MPGTYTYPGVYIEEIPSGVRTIVGVSTSDTAFVDFFARGPMNQAVEITSFEEFQRVFGGLHLDSEASYGIAQFFTNGGQVAWVVRVAGGIPSPTQLTLRGGSPPQATLRVEAANPGVWGNNLQVGVDWKTKPDGFFNLVVREVVTRRNGNGRTEVVASETHRNLGMATASSRYAVNVIKEESLLVRLFDAGLGQLPDPTVSGDGDVTTPGAIGDLAPTAPFVSLGDPGQPASDGAPPDATALIDGLEALDKIAPRIFNILCLPAAAKLADAAMSQVITRAETFCEQKRAFFIVDIPEVVKTNDQMSAWMLGHDGLRHRNAAVYFPRLEVADRLNEGRPRNVGPSGTLAAVYARTDATRGVWKAPAGTDAVLRGVDRFARGPDDVPVSLTDPENGGLNPFGINALRAFPIFGRIIWGARTLEGADQQASEWKYIPVRRTALYVEESLYQGLKWVVFEPNDEPLWAQIRLNVGAFMHTLFRQGAFQGQSPREAYFVKCDKDTTTQDDINRGIVNIVVGFAPLKPAEFVIIKIQQMAGQIQV